MINPFTRAWNVWRSLCREASSKTPVHAERVCPDEPDIVFQGHLEVYRFFGQFVRARAVLDVGCGTGYGSHFLRTQGAASVCGVDYAEEALQYARSHFSDAGLEFRRMDAERLEFPDATFDVVTSSENLEHLPHPDRCIAEVRRVLKPGGLLVLGTPNAEISAPWGRIRNPYHLHEFTYDALDALLRAQFRHVHIFETTFNAGYYSSWMKARRRRRGRIGIEVRGRDAIVLEHLAVDLAHLANSHSFMAIAW